MSDGYRLPTGWTDSDYKAHLQRRASDAKRARARLANAKVGVTEPDGVLEAPGEPVYAVLPNSVAAKSDVLKSAEEPVAPATLAVDNLHRIYHLLDAHGTLLYVGISRDPLRRIQEHSKDKPWWREVSRIELKQRFQDQKSAQISEAYEIKTLRPLYNIVHNRKPYDNG